MFLCWWKWSGQEVIVKKVGDDDESSRQVEEVNFGRTRGIVSSLMRWEEEVERKKRKDAIEFIHLYGKGEIILPSV